jgi:hypothetical protein
VLDAAEKYFSAGVIFNPPQIMRWLSWLEVASTGNLGDYGKRKIKELLASPSSDPMPASGEHSTVVCDVCGGRGFFDTMPASGEYVDVPCDACGGKGYVESDLSCECGEMAEILEKEVGMVLDAARRYFAAGIIFNNAQVSKWLNWIELASSDNLDDTQIRSLEEAASQIGAFRDEDSSIVQDSFDVSLPLTVLINRAIDAIRRGDESNAIGWVRAIGEKIDAIDEDFERAMIAFEDFVSDNFVGAEKPTFGIMRRAHTGTLTEEDYTAIDDVLLPTYTLHETIEAAEKAQGYRIHQDYDWIAIIACATIGELSIEQRKLIQEVNDYIPF